MCFLKGSRKGSLARDEKGIEKENFEENKLIKVTWERVYENHALSRCKPLAI